MVKQKLVKKKLYHILTKLGSGFWTPSSIINIEIIAWMYGLDPGIQKALYHLRPREGGFQRYRLVNYLLRFSIRSLCAITRTLHLGSPSR